MHKLPFSFACFRASVTLRRCVFTPPPPTPNRRLSLCGTLLDDSHALSRHQHVDRRHHEQREQRADDHPADQHDADAVARSGAGAGREHQREVADDRRRGGHQDRAQPRARRLDDRVELVLSRFLEMVGELHDQDAVLRHQTDQRDQPDLAVDIERRQPEEREHQGAGHGQRHRARQDDERIAEALELRREHQVDQDRRQQEGAEELAAFRPELARLAGIVDREALRQDRSRFVFEKPQRLIERHRRRNHALDADRVELLKLLELPRLGGGLQVRERRQRDELVVRSSDVDLRRADRASGGRRASSAG